ncbi:MAG TPA: MarR family transcriptional regulator [Kofleriaceae bacterium]|jgi:DNA-binding MarR family transcriptional regulator|nr:MarR family transcriptional regulator [Kofleriaceae bacterium]
MGSHASRPVARPAHHDAQRVLEALRRLVRFLRLADRTAEEATGASAAQLFVLQQLATAPAASLAELAARTLTDASSVSTVVARLVSRGLVTRRAAAGDKRRAELALTPKGKALLARAPELAQPRIVTAIATMSARDRKAMVDALDHLVDAIGADETEPKLLFEDEPRARRSRS